MMAAVPRVVMALAVSCLGDRRRDWALAMQAEFEAARDDGKPLTFALGCLAAAWREMPMQEEGRFTIASHFLAFVLIIPTAALLAWSIVAGFPYSYLRQAKAYSWLEVAGGQTPLLNEATQAAVPSLAALVAFLAALHLRMAWLVLERDWARLAPVGALIAAATVTLTIFTALVFAYCAPALALAAVLAIELMGVAALARWHDWSFSGSPEIHHA